MHGETLKYVDVPSSVIARMNTTMDLQVPEWVFANTKTYLQSPAFRGVKSSIKKCTWTSWCLKMKAFLRHVRNHSVNVAASQPWRP